MKQSIKCKDCAACRKGFFKSQPDKYVCIGVKEPFVINNIDSYCTEHSIKEREDKNINTPVSLEETDKFFHWLQGEKIEGYTFEHQPKLSADEAFSIIYYLQEEMGVIPDTYEKCDKCQELYDSDCEGTCITEDSEPKEILDEDDNIIKIPWDESDYGHYCDDCRPD